MSDKPDLIQTVATISSMCEMDLSQKVHDEMFEFVAKGISDLEESNQELKTALEDLVKLFPSDVRDDGTMKVGFSDNLILAVLQARTALDKAEV